MEKYKNTFSKIAFGLITIMVVQNIFSIFLYKFKGFIPQNILEIDWIPLVLYLIIQYLIAYPFGLLVINTAPNSPITKPLKKIDLNLKQIIATALSGFAIVSSITAVGNLVTILLKKILQRGLNSNPISDLILDSNPYIMFFVAVILAPIIEEYIFRYFLYKKTSVFGDRIYILFSSLIFGMFHLNILQSLYAFVLGLILSSLYLYTGNIKYPIIIHLIINLLGGGISILTLALNNNIISYIWAILSFILIVIGLFLLLTWFIPKFRNIQFSKGEIELENINAIILNPGMMIFSIIVIVTMINIFFTT
ncbi:MAG: type II CAAX endopeptidase family protein [Miniphocaeibacter sp.]|uniref:CPBP family intramembrane glutamic endopeptidase n=1 Tax=Miniphocaeibacter sp. TaxID=3100973 RepID=UPI0018083099|nr:CPBP family intramembrane metalloprotease [Gallicola sp.]